MSLSAIVRECIFKNQNLHITFFFQDKDGINPFYNIRQKNVNSVQEIIFFVIARPCWMYGLYLVLAEFDRTLLSSRMNYTFCSMHTVTVLSKC